jgi:hypothetical protein
MLFYANYGTAFPPMISASVLTVFLGSVAVDVFSAGVLMIEINTGEVPAHAHTLRPLVH